MSLEKSISEITEKDLQNLVDDFVPEGKNLDYKLTIIDNTREDKKEFLADISSFANASGGHIILGMVEEKGIAKELIGINNINPDAEILRLENLIRDGIEPRIFGISIKAIELPNTNIAFIIYIPNSWSKPHLVNFSNHWRFYSRNSAGKYPLNYLEVKSAFSYTESQMERIRNFRLERLSKIISNDLSIAMDESAKIILHIVPIGTSTETLDIDIYNYFKGKNPPRPIYANGYNHKINFDGFLSYSPKNGNDSLTDSYIQLFKNGTIEAVESFLLRYGDNKKLIPSISYEEELLKSTHEYLTIQKYLNIPLPLALMVTFTGVKNYTLAVDRKYFNFNTHPIDRNELIIPETLIFDYEINLAKLFKPIFDSLWNAAGWEKSLNYDKDGDWRKQ